MTQRDTMHEDPCSERGDIPISPELALRLLIRFKYRSTGKNSWADVERAIKRQGHKYCFLIDRKKLRFWQTRGSVPLEKPYEAITEFIFSKEFISFVPEVHQLHDQESNALSVGISLNNYYGYGFDEHEEYSYEGVSFSFSDMRGHLVEDGNHQDLSEVKLLASKEKEKGVIHVPSYSSFCKITPSPDRSFAYITLYEVDSKNNLNLGDVEPACFFSGYMFFSEKNNKREIKMHLWNRFNREHIVEVYDFEVLCRSIYLNAHDITRVTKNILNSREWPHRNYEKTLENWKMPMEGLKFNPFSVGYTDHIHKRAASKANFLIFSNIDSNEYISLEQYNNESTCPLSASSDDFVNDYALTKLPLIFDKLKYSVVSGDVSE